MIMNGATESETSAAAVVDPVCQMSIEPTEAAGRSEYQGREDYFCSTSCKQKFDANPAAYLQKSPTPSTARSESAGAEWTCPTSRGRSLSPRHEDDHGVVTAVRSPSTGINPRQ